MEAVFHCCKNPHPRAGEVDSSRCHDMSIQEYPGPARSNAAAKHARIELVYPKASICQMEDVDPA
jgi:hypothetical protein